MKSSKVMPIPEGYTAQDIKLESSTCTGEKTIGFYDKHDRKLHYSELVRSERDIRAFYESYGIEYNK
ncbi:MAG: hypothetical protein II820_03650 [Ruminiclostridium sp.]|nr:hypothetical protein [Ruminiclostridium sp.]